MRKICYIQLEITFSQASSSCFLFVCFVCLFVLFFFYFLVLFRFYFLFFVFLLLFWAEFIAWRLRHPKSRKYFCYGRTWVSMFPHNKKELGWHLTWFARFFFLLRSGVTLDLSLVNHKVKITKSEKLGKYLYITRLLKTLLNIKMTVIPIVVESLGTVLQGLEKIGGTGY